jgi:hypothetical protein
VRQHHALRLPRRARGVEDVGELARRREHGRRGRRRPPVVEGVERLAESAGVAHALEWQQSGRRRAERVELGTQLRLEPALEHDGADGAVVEDVGVARRRRARVHRHVGGAGLQDAVDRRDGVDRLARVDADAVPRADPHRAQPVAQAVAELRELAVPHRARGGVHHRGALGPARGRLDEEPVQRLRRPHGRPSPSWRRRAARCPRSC